MTTKQFYTPAWAWSNLPESCYIYEANRDLSCGTCSATIPVNSYFARKCIPGKRAPQPHCRQCAPFAIYTDISKSRRVAQQDEYLYVEGEGKP